MPHVVAVAPVLYDEVFLTGPHGAKLVTLKGIDTRAELATSDTLRHLKAGSLAQLDEDSGLPAWSSEPGSPRMPGCCWAVP